MAIPLFRTYHPDADAPALNHLSSADLGRLAALGKTINRHCTGGDQLFAASTTFGDACKFQQITKTHMVVTQPEFTGFQGQFTYWG